MIVSAFLFAFNTSRTVLRIAVIAAVLFYRLLALPKPKDMTQLQEAVLSLI